MGPVAAHTPKLHGPYMQTSQSLSFISEHSSVSTYTLEPVSILFNHFLYPDHVFKFFGFIIYCELFVLPVVPYVLEVNTSSVFRVGKKEGFCKDLSSVFLQCIRKNLSCYTGLHAVRQQFSLQCSQRSASWFYVNEAEHNLHIQTV